MVPAERTLNRRVVSKGLPPLNALRAFEAAARLLSFTAACQELSVTQAAISYQIRKLESYLGVELFVRLNREIQLTAAGYEFYQTVRQAFDLIYRSAVSINPERNSDHLCISVTQSFGSKGWLMTRLDQFLVLEPKVEIAVQATDQLANFGNDGVDLAIRYAKHINPSLYHTKLFSESIFPVCSPGFMRMHNLTRPAQLLGLPLLHDMMTDCDWSAWLRTAGVKCDKLRVRQHSFGHSILAINAAVAGQGVALGRTPLVIDELTNGWLAQPLAPIVQSDFSYFICCPHQYAKRPIVKRLIKFLLIQARQTADALPMGTNAELV